MTQIGTDPRYEMDPQLLYRDPRPAFDRAWAALLQRNQFITAMAVSIVLVFLIPVSGIVLSPFMFFLGIAYLFTSARAGLPIKMPKYSGLIDPNEAGPDGIPKPADGILYLGNERMGFFGGTGKEIWLSNSDARMHLFTAGTTGAGKTEALLSRVFNSLTWSAGFIYVDGKADNSLVHKIGAMARRCGREDDLLVLNFMQSGKDSFERPKSVRRDSNTMNPMARGTGDFIASLVTSMMPEVSGDSASWREKAVGMIEALIRVLVYLRFKKELLVNPGTIRDYIALPKFIELALRKDLPEDIRAPLMSYLNNLAGFNMKEYQDSGVINEEANKQHGYLSGQFTKLLGTLNETYGHIFKHQLSEVDMNDVVLNNRILIVLIPSLEKSEVESQGLGRLVVSTLRLMMATALGSKLEGTYEDIVDTKVTNSPSPYQVILDELGYYFTKGTAVMFAQARSLGFSITMSGQDKPAMAKGQNKEEVESCIANTKIKECMALEDPGDTFQVFAQSVGEAVVSRTAGFSGQAGSFTVGYQDMLNVALEKQARLTVQELREQKEGQSTILFRANIIRLNTFYVFGGLKFDKKKYKFRLNQFLMVYPPDINEMREILEIPKKADGTPVFNEEMASGLLAAGIPPSYSSSRSLFMQCVQQAAQDICDEDIDAEEKGILFYLRLLQLMRQEPSPDISDLIADADENFTIDAAAVIDSLPFRGDPEKGVVAPEEFDFVDGEESPEDEFEQLQQFTFRPEVYSGLVDVERSLGSDNPESEAMVLLAQVADTLKFKPQTPQQQKNVDEVRALFSALEDELLKKVEKGQIHLAD